MRDAQATRPAAPTISRAAAAPGAGAAGVDDLGRVVEHLAETLAAEHGLPVLDGVTCAIGLAEAMAKLGLKTSRLGGYAPPPLHKLA